MNHQRRRALVIWVLVWVFLGMAGGAAAGEPKPGGTLKIGQVGGILNFDGHRLSKGNYPMLTLVYNTLVQYDDKLKPQPELAESWTFSKNGLMLEFKLREGIRFHNGRELVADDVVWNIQRVQDPKTAAHVRPLSLAIKSAEATGKYRVVLRMEKPTPAVMDLFDTMYIMPKEAVADIQKRGVGTGPFQVVEWVPGDKVVFKKSPDYFRQGLPYIDGVILQQIPDAAALSVNLEAGALDMAFDFSPREAARLMNARKVMLLQSMGGASVTDIMMNVSKAPFDNKKVRQAINYAVDRKRFVDTVLVGFGDPWCQPFPAQSLGFSPGIGTTHCTFDLARAKQLLAEAGYPNGFDAVLHISTATYPNTRQLAQILQADLAKIGVRLTIRDVEPAEYREVTWGTKNKFSIVLHEYGRANRDPDTLFKAAGAWYTKDGMTTFTSPEYVQLVEKAGSALDPAKRRPLYAQIARFLADQAFTIPGSPSFTLSAIKPSAHDVTVNVDGMPILDKAWLER
jgi:peptide/nickel transport system substrate-binding protein